MFFGFGTMLGIGLLGVVIYLLARKCVRQHRQIKVLKETLKQHNIDPDNVGTKKVLDLA